MEGQPGYPTQYPIQAPNAPPQTIADMGQLLARLLSNEYIPENIRNQWWVLCSDDIVLSFLDEKSVQWLMNQYELLELRTIKTYTGHKFDDDTAVLLSSLKIVFFAKLQRAKVMNGMNERIGQVTQISHNIASEKPVSPVNNSGFLASMKRAMGWG